MKKLIRINKCDEFKLYNFLDIINELTNYYNITLEEIEYLLKNYNIKTWDEIKTYLTKEKYTELEIQKRKITYNIYNKKINNLSLKGIELINIIKYLCEIINSNKYNEYYENKLQIMDIFHYSCILKGQDINKILDILFNLINQFNNSIEHINNFNTYDEVEYDEFSLIYGGERICPNKNLIVYDDEHDKNLTDKTSFITKRKVKTKIAN